jgi:hypothetical protein
VFITADLVLAADKRFATIEVKHAHHAPAKPISIVLSTGFAIVEEPRISLLREETVIAVRVLFVFNHFGTSAFDSFRNCRDLY